MSKLVKVAQGFGKHHREPSIVTNLTEKSTETNVLPRGKDTISRFFKRLCLSGTELIQTPLTPRIQANKKVFTLFVKVS